MKITAKQARERFSELLDRAARGEEVIILRRGKPVVRLMRELRAAKARRLPDLSEFRSSIRAHGTPLSALLVQMREEERS